MNDRAMGSCAGYRHILVGARQKSCWAIVDRSALIALGARGLWRGVVR
jgi:hypothetical protein